MLRRRTLLLSPLALVCGMAPRPRLEVADVIFGSFPNSPWARVAASFSSDGAPFGHVAMMDGSKSGQVIDADGSPTGGSVRSRSLQEFLQGADTVEVYRFRLDVRQRREIAQQARAWLGTPFDTRMLLGDDRLYCTELVWKAALAACGIDMVPTKKRVALREVIDIGSLRASRWLELTWRGPARELVRQG